MTAHNLEISDFIKILKDLKAKGHKSVDLEIRDDLTLVVRGVEITKTDNKIGDIPWEETI